MPNQALPPTMPPPAKTANSASSKKEGNAYFGLAIIVFVLMAAVIPPLLMFYPEYQREQLLKNGASASAEIVSVRPTGNYFNNQPQVHVALRVTTENGETFDSVATMIISPFYAPQFQPGKIVRVRYDVNDRSKIAIEETEE